MQGVWGAQPPKMQGVWGAQPPKFRGVWGAKPPKKERAGASCPGGVRGGGGPLDDLIQKTAVESAICG